MYSGRLLPRFTYISRSLDPPLRRPRPVVQFLQSNRLRLYASQPQPNPLPDAIEQDEDGFNHKKDGVNWRSTLFKMFESAMTTFASITILGLVGYSYTRYYKYLVLQKVENAFEPGDPYLDLATKGKVSQISDVHWIERDEQKKIDGIISGEEVGRYFLLIGEKGTGKSSMIIEAMQKINGKGISMLDAHADIEIFRIRLGKALDFEYHEDNIGSLFSIRGPRDASALLDIERAFNKLEKVAIQNRDRGGRPFVLVINSMHLLRDDEDGTDLLELIQQRAEQWCATSLITIVLNSDDYWVYERLKQHATRMDLIPVTDLPMDKAIEALKVYRKKWHFDEPDESTLLDVYERLGGRMAFLSQVAKASNMIQACEEICAKEKTWFLNKCWILGEPMDDDVMDQQKYAVRPGVWQSPSYCSSGSLGQDLAAETLISTNWSNLQQSAAMVLAKALVEKEKEMGQVYDEKNGHMLPTIPLHEARQIMTRADFIQSYDQVNLFTIDSKAMVRADSVPMQRAFREIVTQEGFDDYLQATLDRISAIESLGRTRELTIKDLWNKGKYHITFEGGRGQADRHATLEVAVPADEAEAQK